MAREYSSQDHVVDEEQLHGLLKQHRLMVDDVQAEGELLR
jgi:hypothetical protein